MSFAALDASLYLDTHPNDAEALEYFHHFNKARQQALHEYAVRFGPLTLNGAQTDDTWKWATQPCLGRGIVDMFNYEKRLQYPVNIRRTDAQMAKAIITQFGGPDGLLV